MRKKVVKEIRKMRPYEDLASAIVYQAVSDYRCAKKILKRKPHHRKLLAIVADIEKFFRSDWYRILTKINGEMLLDLLEKEG